MKKKVIIIVSCSIVLLSVCLYFVLNKNPNTTPVSNESETCEDCTIVNDTNRNKAKNFNLTYSGKTIEYNAYDFIIEKMSQAQYWTYEQYEPIYNLHYNMYEPSKHHIIENATGFILYDEDTASFARGFEGRLIINFSENSAISNDYFCLGNFDTEEEINTDFSLFNSPELDYKYVFDFISEKEIMCGEEWGEEEHVILPDYEGIDGVQPYNEIKHTLKFYNDVFSELDIPLLNMPKGTLASYKNKTIDVPVELLELKYYDRWCDDKIHSPFDERVGWEWYWENNDDNVWLDDYRDILNKQFPESTENEMMPTEFEGTPVDYYYYAPNFLCVINKHSTSNYENDMMTGNTYYNVSGAYATYYLKPLYKTIFGFNGVYFYDINNIHYDSSKPDTVGSDYTRESFLNNNLNTSIADFILDVYNKGDVTSAFSETAFIGFGGLYNLEIHLNDLLEHYNVECPFGEDYLTMLLLLYNISLQQTLGLR